MSDGFHFLANDRHFQSVELQNKAETANKNPSGKIQRLRKQNISSLMPNKVKLICRALSRSPLLHSKIDNRAKISDNTQMVIYHPQSLQTRCTEVQRQP